MPWVATPAGCTDSGALAGLGGGDLDMMMQWDPDTLQAALRLLQSTSGPQFNG